MKHIVNKLPLLIFLVIVSCHPAEKMVTESSSEMTKTPVSVVSSTTPSPLLELKSTPTPSPTLAAADVFASFEEFQKGQYLLVREYKNGKPYLLVISSDKTIVFDAPEKAFLLGTSNDGTRLLVHENKTGSYRELNLVKFAWTELDLGKECEEPSWAPDDVRLVFACIDGNIDIYEMDVQADSIAQISDCDSHQEKDIFCDVPSLSPDGNWLAYSRIEVKSGPASSENGVYVFNTACIEGKECMDVQFGPIDASSNPIWLEENILLVAQNNIIYLYKIKDNISTLISKTETDVMDIRYVSLSPNREFLVYSPLRNDTVYITNLSIQFSDNDILIEGENIFIVGWVTIP